MNDVTQHGENGSLVDELISEDEAAKKLGRSRQWLRNLRLDGEGPTYVDLGNTVAYYPQDVAEWLKSRRKEPTKQTRKAKPAATKKKAAPAARKAAASTTKSE